MRNISEISESLWGKTLMRDIDDEERKEDKLSLFFGPNIDCRLYSDEDGNVLFTYDEALEIEKKEKGWRLPTIRDFEPFLDDEYKVESDRERSLYSPYGDLTLPFMGWKDEDGVLRCENTTWIIFVKGDGRNYYTIGKTGKLNSRDQQERRKKKMSILLLHEKDK